MPTYVMPYEPVPFGEMSFYTTVINNNRLGVEHKVKHINDKAKTVYIEILRLCRLQILQGLNILNFFKLLLNVTPLFDPWIFLSLARETVNCNFGFWYKGYQH